MACTCPAVCRSGDGACLPCLAGCTQVARLPLAMLAVDTAACASCQITAKLANHSCAPLCRAPPRGGRVARAGVPLNGATVSIKFSFRMPCTACREAEFSELECRLTAQQVAAYDAAAALWAQLRDSLVLAVAGLGVMVGRHWAGAAAAQSGQLRAQQGCTGVPGSGLQTAQPAPMPECRHSRPNVATLSCDSCDSVPLSAATGSDKDVWKPFWAAQQRCGWAGCFRQLACCMRRWPTAVHVHSIPIYPSESDGTLNMPTRPAASLQVLQAAVRQHEGAHGGGRGAACARSGLCR